MYAKDMFKTLEKKGMDDPLRSLDHGNVSVLTLLDFSDAFDTVDHTILLQHLDVSLA